MTDIEIQGHHFFLVRVGGGTAVHLARDVARDRGKTLATLCGRDGLHPLQDSEAVPTCRRCLASIDRLFPKPSQDPRVNLLAERVVQALDEHGIAEVMGVPGDQMPALRAAVRNAVRRRLGFKLSTHVVGSRLVINCPEAFARHKAAHMQTLAQRLNTLFSDEGFATIDDSGWRLDWATWRAQ